jgi:hypothetical protein
MQSLLDLAVLLVCTQRWRLRWLSGVAALPYVVWTLLGLLSPYQNALTATNTLWHAFVFLLLGMNAVLVALHHDAAQRGARTG